MTLYQLSFCLKILECFTKVALTTFTILNGNYTHTHMQHINKHCCWEQNSSKLD